MEQKILEKAIVESPKQIHRFSNIELLRITATIFIIVYHYCVHGAISEVYVHTTNKLASIFLSTEGQVGINIFFLITGYFMINSKFNTKKILKLCFQVFFYSVLLAVVAVHQALSNFELTPINIYFTPIVKKIYWFATCYVSLYLIFPFLNKLVRALGKSGCQKFLIFCTLALSVLPTFFNVYFMLTEFSWGIFMYVLGAYISLYNFDFKNKRTSIIISILHPIIVFILSLVLIYLNKKFSLSINREKCICYYSLFSIIAALGYFVTFKNMNIKQNKFINYLGKISFATYLITDHQLFRRYFWFLDCKTGQVINSPLYIFLLHIFICVVGIYICTAIIEFVRITLLQRPLFKIKIFDKYITKIDNFMNSI